MENVFGSFCRMAVFVGKWKMFLAVFVGKWKMFLAVFVGKWKMFWLFPCHNARHNNFKQA